jgi:hypothetical protein
MGIINGKLIIFMVMVNMMVKYTHGKIINGKYFTITINHLHGNYPIINGDHLHGNGKFK